MVVCPSCHEELSVISFKGVDIHECSTCHGRWFERNELKKVKDHEDHDLVWLDFDPFDQKINHEDDTPEGVLCPQCQTEMFSLPYSHSDIFIDKCNKCHGIWLSQGDFEKIILYLEDLLSQESSTELFRDSFSQFIQIAQHKKGISDGLGDFLVCTKILRQRIGVEHPHLANAVNKIYECLPFL